MKRDVERIMVMTAATMALAATPQPTSRPESWDRFTGSWRTSAAAAQIVDRAIDEATASMSIFSRGVARGRLRKANAPPATIRLERQDSVFVIRFDDQPELRLPLSGEPVRVGERTIRVQLDEGENGALRHVGETGEGRRENVYRIGSTADVLHLDVTVTSPRLPAPMHYTLALTRATPRHATESKESETRAEIDPPSLPRVRTRSSRP